MKISAALAAYNGEKYIEEQLDSIRCQTRVPDEVIVVDDASTDGTWDILVEYRKKYPAFPLQLFRNAENRGFRNNFLTALTECSGDLQFLADQDDIWEPDKVRIMADMFVKNPDLLVLASSFTLIDGSGEPFAVKARKGWSNQNLFHKRVEKNGLCPVTTEDLIWHNFCQGAAQAFRASIRERFIRNFTEALPHDRMINLLGAAEQGLYFYNVSLFKYRIHADNSLGLKSKANAREKMGMQYRTMEAREALAYVDTVKRLYPDLYAGSRRLQGAEKFLRENIGSMENRKTLRILKQSIGRDYRCLKSEKGILGDILFSVRNR
ncbi:MAG: glycosyltransferase [Eubacteriales bacterium]|nr:glycosyltransferase [Eubacteriales bacterium]